MFIEFLDQLRCTQSHDDSWLVASFAEQHDRFIVRGTLGCPLCFRQYPIIDGVAYFDVAPRSRASDTPAVGGPGAGDSEIAMRAAALLNARERSTLVLAGTWAPHAHAVTELLPMRIFALNPSAPIDDSELVAVLWAADAVPLTPASIDGVALDANTADEATVRAALHVLRPGGRLVAPVAVPLPAGVKELARDETVWVGEKDPSLVLLRRR